MRIVSGKYRGRRISAPNNLPVRPTTDMAKEALFNILNNTYYLDEVSVLDLFAGIGSISFEFASRGCLDVLAVDANAGCIKFLETTNDQLDAGIQTIKSDVFKYLEKNNRKFDIIFADPPYAMETAKFVKLINLIFDRNLLNDQGILIIEHSKQTDLSEHANFERARKYGGNVFSFFEATDAEASNSTD
ncbi:16S rRNA (guanine(966)-N(2))-methyltransferase RsmD [Lutimonas sp.]|uniref:16S rRNA (guanine(966)-N(2))-methyltransferase RsmD n=1 Tax=Lutimonas sp. TaxID=1872403 RepID=UPI003D9BD8A2